MLIWLSGNSACHWPGMIIPEIRSPICRDIFYTSSPIHKGIAHFVPSTDKAKAMLERTPGARALGALSEPKQKILPLLIRELLRS